MKTEIIYQENPIEDIMRHFAKDFIPKEGGRIVLADWFYDQHKGVVVFKLMVETNDGK